MIGANTRYCGPSFSVAWDFAKVHRDRNECFAVSLD